MKKETIVVAVVAVLLIVVVLSVAIVDLTYHEWHPIGPNVKFGTLIEKEEVVEEEPELYTKYEKKRFVWNSNEITEDSVTIDWTLATGSTSLMTITATSIDIGPDANAWVRFDWCSRHGEVRAVRVE